MFTCTEVCSGADVEGSGTPYVVGQLTTARLTSTVPGGVGVEPGGDVDVEVDVDVDVDVVVVAGRDVVEPVPLAGDPVHAAKRTTATTAASAATALVASRL